MRVCVLAFDTQGGVQPYVALAEGLAHAGHDVTMVTTDDFADLVAGRGVRHAPVPGDTETGTWQAVGLAEKSRRDRDRLMREQLGRSLGPTTDAVEAAAADADLLIGGVGGSITGRPVAEHLGIPWLDAHLQPLGPPTAAFPGVLTARLPSWAGAVGRRASHRATNAALHVMFGEPRRQVRAHLGLPRRPRGEPRDLPALYGFSPLVVPQPTEWCAGRKVTGYWTLPQRADLGATERSRRLHRRWSGSGRHRLRQHGQPRPGGAHRAGGRRRTPSRRPRGPALRLGWSGRLSR